MINIVDQKVLDKVKRQIYVIKFQKRDFTYVHILLILDDFDKFQNVADVDTIIFVYILDQNKN